MSFQTMRLVSCSAASFLIAALAVGCGSSKKSSEDSSVVDTVETTIVSTAAEGQGSRIKFKSNVANAKFQCQISVDGRDGEWSACGEEGVLVTPQAGTATTFKVKAISPSGVESSIPASATLYGSAITDDADTSTQAFVAQILGKSEVPSEWSQPNMTLNLGVKGGQVGANQVSFQCRLAGESQFTACPGGNSYSFAGLQDGTYGLTVRAVQTQTGIISAEDNISFNVRLAAVTSTSSSQVVVIPPPTMLLGDSYTFTAAENMQVNSFGTNQTVNGRFAYSQIMQDPFFVGNYDCINHQAMVKSYGGNVYCDVTPGRDLFAWLTQGTVAMNHIELATKSALVESNPIDHTRITLNLFDAGYEFSYVRSRFDWLCRNKRATITRTAHKIPLAHSFWEGELVGADFMSCVADVAGAGGGLGGMPEKWYVGSFFISTSGFDLPSYDCFRNFNGRGSILGGSPWNTCGDYRNPRLLEVTVMTRLPMYEPSEFARYAQSLFLGSLRQAAPMTRY